VPREAFSDLDKAEWAREYIVKLKERNIVSGRENGLFDPNGAVTREEFVKIVVVAFGIPASDTAPDFDDVPEGAWYTPYVKAAAGKGVVNGSGDGVFSTGQRISRQDVAVILDRTVRNMGYEPEEREQAPVFADKERISGYAQSSVQRLGRLGVLSGDDEGRVRPETSATRAEAAKMICLLMEKAGI
jgi:hypothetical protein